MATRKGIILAGGSATRLKPISSVISKQLLPVYDKPMIFYPLSTLMLGGIREICLISTPHDIGHFSKLLGDGADLGCKITYIIQDQPKGIAEAFILAQEFLGEDSSALILGDNIFHGDNLTKKLEDANQINNKATVFAYQVNDPERYGVVDFDENNSIKSIEEKPLKPKSKYAVTGLYFYDNRAVDFVNELSPSKRGELEISDLNKIYLDHGDLNLEILGRGYAWLDTGTVDSLLDASNYVSAIQKRQGFKVGSPHEIAARKGWISKSQLLSLADTGANEYHKYLKGIADEL